MSARRLTLWAAGAALLLLLLLAWAPDANADPIVQPLPTPPGPGIGGPSGPGLGDESGPNAELAPGEAVFLCPGVGGSASVLGAGGGYCDFNFQRTSVGTGHIHCEWGGASPIVSMWNCWRVFPGQPDHPAHPDPDIIPDGWGVPWAILGPTPNDQWPPPGLAPAPLPGPPASEAPAPEPPPPGG